MEASDLRIFGWKRLVGIFALGLLAAPAQAQFYGMFQHADQFDGVYLFENGDGTQKILLCHQGIPHIFGSLTRSRGECFETVLEIRSYGDYLFFRIYALQAIEQAIMDLENIPKRFRVAQMRLFAGLLDPKEELFRLTTVNARLFKEIIDILKSIEEHLRSKPLQREESAPVADPPSPFDKYHFLG